MGKALVAVDAGLILGGCATVAFASNAILLFKVHLIPGVAAAALA